MTHPAIENSSFQHGLGYMQRTASNVQISDHKKYKINKSQKSELSSAAGDRPAKDTQNTFLHVAFQFGWLRDTVVERNVGL